MENDMRKTAIESNPALEKSVEDMARGRMLTPQERTRKAVHATGNRWAIENFEATHN